MALQILISHTGGRLYADPNTLPSYVPDPLHWIPANVMCSPDALRSWIAEHAAVPAGRQILMTARGKNVKQQHLLTEV